VKKGRNDNKMAGMLILAAMTVGLITVWVEVETRFQRPLTEFEIEQLTR
jgi:hypothetical protein